MPNQRSLITKISSSHDHDIRTPDDDGRVPERIVEAKKRPRDTEGTVSLLIFVSWMKNTTIATRSRAMAT